MPSNSEEAIANLAKTSPLLVFYLFCTRNSQLHLVNPDEAKLFEHYYTQSNARKFKYGVAGALSLGGLTTLFLQGTGVKKGLLVTVAALLGIRGGIAYSARSSAWRTEEIEMNIVMNKYVDLMANRNYIHKLSQVV